MTGDTDGFNFARRASGRGDSGVGVARTGVIVVAVKLRMHPNSLFAVLLRSPWWISVVIAVALAAAARLFLPDLYALAMGAPFLVIGVVAGWRQLRAPSAKRVAGTVEAVRAMSWNDFAAAIEAGFRRKTATIPVDSAESAVGALLRRFTAAEIVAAAAADVSDAEREALAELLASEEGR